MKGGSNARRDASALLVAIVFLAAMVSLAACGSESAGEGAAANDTSSSAVEITGRDAEMVAPTAVRNCAGVSVEDAAQVLGVPAAEMQDASQDLYEGARQCAYQSTSDMTKMVGFSLVTYESVQEAVDQMAYGRGNAGLARGTIESVTLEDSGAPALEDLDGIGDDAFWMEINNTLNVRVGNVLVQVQTPEDQEKQKAVARTVAEGLQG